MIPLSIYKYTVICNTAETMELDVFNDVFHIDCRGNKCLETGGNLNDRNLS